VSGKEACSEIQYDLAPNENLKIAIDRNVISNFLFKKVLKNRPSNLPRHQDGIIPSGNNAPIAL